MRKLLPASAMLLATVPHASLLAANHSMKLPLDVHARPVDNCFYLRLDGVATADPAISSVPWFSLRKDHPHFAEFFALFLTAQAGKIPINVETAGTACSNASVQVVALR